MICHVQFSNMWMFNGILKLFITKNNNRIFKTCKHDPIIYKIIYGYLSIISTHFHRFIKNCLNNYLMSTMIFFSKGYIITWCFIFSFIFLLIKILNSNQLKYLAPVISNMASVWIHKSEEEKPTQRKTLVLLQQEYKRLKKKKKDLKITTFILKTNFWLLYSM